MKFPVYVAFFAWLLFGPLLVSQKKGITNWNIPLESITQFEGKGWNDIGYQRLPDKAKNTVRDAVWSLSKHAAGLGIRFETDADSIFISYAVDGNLAMPHMPATGVSGVDLYSKVKGGWLWCRGKYQFKDTVQYDFYVDKPIGGPRTYQLYFPLYNNIKNLKIGVEEGHKIVFLPVRPEKPIVVYGTSIAQGGCASRPGMAWTNILSRKLDYPILNLGFSGNGRLEPEVIDLISEIDAAVFILDCLPNLTPTETRTEGDIKGRIRKSVQRLRERHPETPILLVQHPGYSDGLIDSTRQKVYESLNTWLAESFDELKKEGLKQLFQLTKDDIGLTNDAFVDGTHPTDLGMEQYAMAYEKILVPILSPKE